MAYQQLGLGSSANDGTGDDLRTGGDKINDNFVELYTKLGNGSTLSNLTFPTGTDTIVGRATTDTLTNKTLTSPTINGATVSSSLSGNFTLVFEGATADAYETTLTVTDPTSSDKTITLPDATGTVSLVTGTETLTNKTLTAPKIADAGFIADANGAEQIIFQTTASAVNEIEITNAATGGAASAGTSTAPIIGASGETNVDLALLPKGTGHVAIRSTGGANNQGAIRLNCEQNTHGQTLMSQPHSAGDSGYFMLPVASASGNARSAPDVLLSGSRTIAETETANGAGSSVALSLDVLHSAIVTTGAQAFSLANGSNGQLKTISMVTDGGDATLTPATLAGGTTITFNDVGDSVVLIYNTTGGWAVLSNNGATVA
jgi:hypothetical protein